MNGITTNHIWDGSNIAAETDGSQAVTARYYRGAALIAQEKQGSTEYFQMNGRGDVTGLTDSSGENVKTFTYDAFGNQLSEEETSATPFRYNGEYYDEETDLIYLRNRYYSPSVGQFITEDPAKDGTNWYVYCRNNPVMFVDPIGLTPTAREAAEMAEHIYHYDENSEFEDRQIIIEGYDTGWRLINVWEKGGCKMGIYIRGDEASSYDGPIEYTIAFKGTDSIGGWINNLLQPFGLSPAMTAAINMGYGFTEMYGSSEITFAGHSKGGAEAIAAAVATNRNAFVFNSAIPLIHEYGLSTEYYTGIIIHLTVYHEIISAALGLPNESFEITLPTQYEIDYSSEWAEFWSRVANHHMEAVLKAMEEANIW